VSEVRTQLSRPVADRLVGAGQVRRRATPSAKRIHRRRLMVAATKWSLPLFALLLLGSLAIWPELVRVKEQGRVAFRRAFNVDPESGRMVQPRYRGLDERGRPYTVTAATAQQTSAERVAMTDPKGDIVTESGTWVMVEAKEGVYIQHQALMDLSGEVTLYREDGTTMRTDAASIDLKSGAAASDDKTHAEGPFGVLDAQGFTLTDKGAAIQFQGPAHLVVNTVAQAKAPEAAR
jgi:lipopolysaccharide export system protein LptC